MSSTRSNGLTADYSGKFGNQYVLRCRNGRSNMSKLPKRTKTTTSEAQDRVKNNFKAAAAYAKDKLSIPELREAYLLRGNGLRSAYIMAMADSFHPPVINNINADFYRGHAGDVIRIEAVDNFRVEKVMFYLYDEDNQELEFGECVQAGEGSEWDYTILNEHVPTAGQKIKVVAYDLPGHPGQAILEI